MKCKCGRDIYMKPRTNQQRAAALAKIAKYHKTMGIRDACSKAGIGLTAYYNYLKQSLGM